MLYGALSRRSWSGATKSDAHPGAAGVEEGGHASSKREVSRVDAPGWLVCLPGGSMDLTGRVLLVGSFG